MVLWRSGFSGLIHGFSPRTFQEANFEEIRKLSDKLLFLGIQGLALENLRMKATMPQILSSFQLIADPGP